MDTGVDAGATTDGAVGTDPDANISKHVSIHAAIPSDGNTDKRCRF